MFLTHFTHCSFDYLLDLDVISFNALLDAATRLDAGRWRQLAWSMRAAQHAEGKAFEKMMKESWGHADDDDGEEKQSGRGIKDLIRQFGGGF